MKGRLDNTEAYIGVTREGELKQNEEIDTEEGTNRSGMRRKEGKEGGRVFVVRY